MADAKQVLEQVRQVSQALVEARLRMAELGKSSVTVQGSVTRSLGQVRAQVTRLGQTLVPVGNLGLNLLRRVLALLQPVAKGLSSFAVTLFGGKLAGQVKGFDQAAGAVRRTDRALQQAAKSTGRVAKAAREARQAQRDLMSFDEINRLSPREPENASGAADVSDGGAAPKSASGGTGGGTDAAVRALEVPVSRLAQRIRRVLGDIWAPFQQAWRNRGEYVLNAARTGLEQVRDAAKAVGRTWLAVWKDGTGERIVGEVLTIAGDLCLVVGNLAQRFQEAWERCGSGERIVRAVFGIVEDALGWVEALASATVDWSKSLDLAPLLSGVAGLLEGFRNLAGVVGGALADVYRDVLLPLAKWTIERLAPELVELLANAMNLLAGALRILWPGARAVWEGFLQPLARWTGEAAIGALHGLNTVLEGLAGLLDDVADIVNGSGSWPQKLSRIGGLLVGGLKEGVSAAVSGLGGWVSDQLGAPVTGALAGLGQRMKTGVRNAVEELSGFWSGVRSLFAGFGRDAADGIGSGFGGSVRSAFSAAYRSVCDLWSGLGETFRGFGESASRGLRGNLRSDVRRAFAGAYENACGAWSGAAERFRSIGASAARGLKEGLGNHIPAALSAAYTAACSAWKGAGERFRSIGTKVVSGLRGGLGNHIRTAFSTAYAAACGAWSGAGERFRSVGSAAVNGLRGGLGNHIRTAFSSAYTAACSAWSGISGKFSGFAASAVSALRSGFSGAGSALTAPVRAGLNGVIAMANRAIGGINSALAFRWDGVQIGGYTVVQPGSATLARLPYINYLARGGVLERATPIVAGEAGAEAVVPLEHNLGWLDRLAERLAGQLAERGSAGPGAERPIVVQCVLDGRVIASNTVEHINRQARATGVNPLSAYI